MKIERVKLTVRWNGEIEGDDEGIALVQFRVFTMCTRVTYRKNTTLSDFTVLIEVLIQLSMHEHACKTNS